MTRPRGRSDPRPPRLALLVHAYYEEDARVRRQAETLVAAGWEVEVFALRLAGEPAHGELAGVRLVRLDVQRHQGAGIATYLREYLGFFWRAALAVRRRQREAPFDVGQAASLPDFLVFALLPLRVRGVPVVLDLHEAMPEFFRMRFARSASPLALAALRLQERLAIRFANAVMTVNDALGDRLVGLGVPRRKLLVLLNTPDLTRFDAKALPARPFMVDGTLRLVYAGALTPTYELDLVLEALAALQVRRPELQASLDVYGRGDAEVALRDRAAALGLAETARFHGRIPLEAVPAAIAAADIGLAPTRRTRFTDFSLSTKLFEYAALARPVVASDLPTVARYFPPGTISTYVPGDADSLTSAIERLIDEPAQREARIAATSARLADLSWSREGAAYVAMLERLAANRRRA